MSKLMLDSGVAIVIPAKNEQMTIKSVICDLKRYVNCEQIIVVDDGSTDATACIAHDESVVLLRHIEAQGAWRAMQTGMLYAIQCGFEKVITMDADGQHLASELILLIENAKVHKSDLVVGSDPSRASAMRSFAWDLFRFFTRLEIKDLTSGFRLYSKKALKILTREEMSLLEYQDMGVLLTLRAHHLVISETPVKISARQHGHSKIFSSWFKVMYYMMTTLTLSLSKNRKLPQKQTLEHDL